MNATNTMTAVEKSAPRLRIRPDAYCISAVAAFVVLSAGLLVGAPSVLRLAFPVLALVAGGVLYFRSKPTYLTFTMWLWFLTSFVRRLVDHRAGYVATNPVLLAPFLVAGLAAYTMLTRSRSLGRLGGMPFTCALAGIIFGTGVGLTRYPVAAVGQAVLNWVVPVIFAFFLYEERRYYDHFRVAIERSLLYGVLVMGAYGLYQWVFMPAWDAEWIVGVNSGAFGDPEPFKVRIFSTLNASPSFATYMMAGLLILFCVRGWTRVVAAPLGFLSLALSIVRSAYLGLAAGLIYLTFQMPMRVRMRIIAGVIPCVLLLGVATQIPVVDRLLSTRVNSLFDPKNDDSFNARVYGHQVAFEHLIHEPFGEGMGSTDTDHDLGRNEGALGPHDSTLLEFLYAMGLPGTIIYFLGIAQALFSIFFRREGTSAFAISMRAILVACFIQSPLNSTMLGVHGFIVWVAIGMTLAEEPWQREARSRVQMRPFWQRG